MRGLPGLLELRRRPLAYLLSASRQGGPLVPLARFPRRVFLVNDPVCLKHVLQDRPENYIKGPAIGSIRPLFGTGLTTSDGVLWARQRRLLFPAYQPRQIPDLQGIVRDITAAMLARWQDRIRRGESIDIAAEMLGLTRDIVFRITFGAGGEAEVTKLRHAIPVALEEINRRAWALWQAPLWLPLRHNLRLRRTLEDMNGAARALIAARRRQAEDRRDLLGALLALEDEETGRPMSDMELRDELVTLLIAGHTTAAAALAWTFMVLAHHPRAETRLLQELRAEREAPGSRGDESAGPQYVRRVLMEVLRLYPPTWITARVALNEDCIDGCRVQARTLLLLCPYTMHRHPAWWDNPERFDPDRFLPERSAARTPFAYFPFGGGPRDCAGKGLAMMEIQLVLAMIVSRCRLQLAGPMPAVPPCPGLTLAPPAGVWMRFSPRDSHSAYTWD
jgi:cytochrome P450